MLVGRESPAVGPINTLKACTGQDSGLLAMGKMAMMTYLLLVCFCVFCSILVDNLLERHPHHVATDHCTKP